MESIDTIDRILKRLYGQKDGSLAYDRILGLMERFPASKKHGKGYFSQEDVVLITYGDTLHKEEELPLVTFHEFARNYFKGVFSTIHFLPFFPYSSDDGFSVKDFFSINPELGSWRDVSEISRDFRLMFDLVLNHASAKGKWFENYLAGDPGYENLAIEVDPSVDLTSVVRPRSLPLLTRVTKNSGEIVHVWTTFSDDQIDLNYKSIDVLEKMVEVLLFYVKQGATILRLDAIAYLWKEIGTSCIHLSQVHDVVILFRKILDRISPDVMIVTETNVPHDENISYFGDGQNEAQMVYNFTLPPLLVHTFASEDSTVLSRWAKELQVASESNTFFNFTASHDGIGVRPLEGILEKVEIDRLIEMVQRNGGQVSYKKNSDGSESPYELNITYVDALLKQYDDPYHSQRFLAAQAIQFVLPGVPATYIHSIMGSRNWKEGVRQTGRARTINREKLQIDTVSTQLKNPETFRSRIFFSYIELIKIRKKQPAFHPNASFEILGLDHKIFAIARYCQDQTIYAVTNISSKSAAASLSEYGAPTHMKDLISEKTFSTSEMRLNPYQFVWLSN